LADRSDFSKGRRIETRNPKLETLSKFEIQMPNFQNLDVDVLTLGHYGFEFI